MWMVDVIHMQKTIKQKLNRRRIEAQKEEDNNQAFNHGNGKMLSAEGKLITFFNGV